MFCYVLLYKFHDDDDDEDEDDGILCVNLMLNLNNLSN